MEDEALVAMMMEDLLQESGCEVVASFSTVGAAMDWLQTHETDLDGAVLDVNLGGGETAFPVARVLMERGVPIAFATGYGVLPSDGFAEVPVLRKPVDLGMVALVVDGFRAS